MIDKLNINEYSQKRKTISDFLKPFFNTLTEKELDKISSHLLNNCDFDINNEKQVQILNKYIENWNFRNTQTNKINFYAPVETTIINCFFKQKEIVNMNDFEYFSDEFKNICKIVANFQNEPTVMGLVKFDINKINPSHFNVTYKALNEVWNTLFNSYHTNKYVNIFNDEFVNFNTEYKYNIIFLEKYEFIYRTKEDAFVEKENKKIKIRKSDLVKMYEEFITLLDHFYKILIWKLNELLTHSIINKFEKID